MGEGIFIRSSFDRSKDGESREREREREGVSEREREGGHRTSRKYGAL
jgi:hypothetical protein